jgi:pimeloyl-ACP methyl ester carboxylesterase
MMDKKKKLKFVFLSHGFQASHYDMLKMKHYFSNYRPDVRFICIKSNEEKTTDDIGELGLNLAADVNKLLENDFVAGNIESVSFIGHSMGKRYFIKVV